jgi:Ca2+:H+ antiporter
MKLLKFVKEDPFSVLIIALPLAALAKYAGWGDLWVFLLSALGVIPMAHYIGEATDVLARYTGPQIGGFLNATLGNAAELIITIFAIREGLLELVKASITGSILGNLLLVLGMSMLFGGVKNGSQSFDQKRAGNHAVLLVLAVLGMLIPSIFFHYQENSVNFEIEALSIGVAVIMIILYLLGLVFSLKIQRGPLMASADENHEPAPKWSARTGIIVLALSTAGVAYLSELLVGSVEHVVSTLQISEFFLGIILIPIIGNVAEHLVALQVAVQNKMDLSVEISLASSLQIALFVAPILVFISLLFGNPLTLIFNEFEIPALGAAVLIAALVAADGESNWLEGAELLAVYGILGLAFFLLPM